MNLFAICVSSFGFQVGLTGKDGDEAVAVKSITSLRQTEALSGPPASRRLGTRLFPWRPTI